MRIWFLMIVGFLVALPAQAGEWTAGPIAADIVRVRDGDTVDVIAHVWPGHDIRVSVRIRGIDAPEMKARCVVEKQQALAARDELRNIIGSGAVQLTNISGGKYFGRVLSTVVTASGQNVKTKMLLSGLAVPYKGRQRKDWCPESAHLAASDF